MKKDRNDERKINYACATVQGEYHKAQGIENQDNFIFQSKPEYAIMSVADGVGSQVYASEGSRSAVMAAAHALEAYAEGSIACEEIVGTLRSFYRNAITRGHESHAGTTTMSRTSGTTLKTRTSSTAERVPVSNTGTEGRAFCR